MNKLFTDIAFREFEDWQKRDRKIFKRIFALIKDIERDPFTGIGKPEPLRENFSGYWSRRINEEHRLVYTIEGDNITIVQCRYHYR